MLGNLAHILDAVTRTGGVSTGLRRAVVVAAAALMLAGCAQPWQQFHGGEDQSAIIARMGQPREIHELPDGGRRLMWPTQPMGTTNVVADINASGKIVNVRQALQLSEFNQAQIGKWTRDDVRANFGPPAESGFFRRTQREVWSYRYMENNITPMMFHFSFDTNGVLREVQRTPDTTRDRNLRRF